MLTFFFKLLVIAKVCYLKVEWNIATHCFVLFSGQRTDGWSLPSHRDLKPRPPSATWHGSIETWHHQSVCPYYRRWVSITTESSNSEYLNNLQNQVPVILRDKNLFKQNCSPSFICNFTLWFPNDELLSSNFFSSLSLF